MLRTASPLRSSLALGLALGLAPLAGCGQDVDVHDLDFTVLIPRSAATRVFPVSVETTITNPNTGLEQTESRTELKTFEGDPRVIGPVFLGLYDDVQEGLEQYPAPARGPVLDAATDLQGFSYPYGGTTVGDYRFACLAALTCRVPTGRFVDYQAIVDFFVDDLSLPIVDSAGQPVTTGERLKQECYDLLEVTDDYEVRLTAYQDRNDDGAIDAADLDFVEDENGDFVANVRIWQQEFVEGSKLWGFMDAPGSLGTEADAENVEAGRDRGFSYDFTTCDPNVGFLDQTYSNEVRGTYAFRDVLNQPYKYIGAGDYVTRTAHTWTTPYEIPQIVLDLQVTGSLTVGDDTAQAGGAE